MERLACVKLPLFALQLVLKAHPEWRNFPAVLLDRLHPQGLVLQANKGARRARVLPGTRYAAGLSLCPDLRATTLKTQAYQAGEAALREIFERWSPRFDSPADFSDLAFLNGAQGSAIFWLQARGMDRLYGSFQAWAQGLEDALNEAEFYAAIAVGFSRFGTYVLAHATGVGAHILPTPQEEQRLARAQPISRLSLAPGVIEALVQLGVERVGEFLELPPTGIASRFGQEIRILYDFSINKYRIPIKKISKERPVERIIYFESAEFNAERVLFRVKFKLHEMAVELSGRGLVLGELELLFRLADSRTLLDRVRPARPSLDESAWMELIRLRLEKLEFEQPPAQLRLVAAGYLGEAEQARLLSAAHDRRWEDAQHALARLRAEFGPDAVLQVELKDAHLPEARFALSPLEKLARPGGGLRPSIAQKTAKQAPQGAICEVPGSVQRGPKNPPSLVRRILIEPAPLGPLVPRAFQDSLAAQRPYLISGGWWQPEEVEREYYYVETARGELLWVFYDRVRGGWFVHGRVE